MEAAVEMLKVIAPVALPFLPFLFIIVFFELIHSIFRKANKGGTIDTGPK